MTINRISDSRDPLSIQRLLYEAWKSDYLVSSPQLANMLSLTTMAIVNYSHKGSTFNRYGYHFRKVKIDKQTLWKIEKIEVTQDDFERGYVRAKEND